MWTLLLGSVFLSAKPVWGLILICVCFDFFYGKSGLQDNTGPCNAGAFTLFIHPLSLFSFPPPRPFLVTCNRRHLLFIVSFALAHTCKYFLSMTRRNDKSSQIKATLLRPVFPLSVPPPPLLSPCVVPSRCAWLEQVPFPPPLAEVVFFSFWWTCVCVSVCL